MEENNGQDREGHGGMNHGMGAMLLGCVVPVAAILLLPRLGVSSGVSVAIGIGAMIVLHAGMMLVPRLKKRKGGAAAPHPETGHGHH